MKVKAALLLSVIFLISSVLPVSAAREGVLGLSTDHLSIPPTVEGPGFLLPDSPLYFLDNLKQQVRLFFAFTPAAKAKVYAAIAGERMAELRFELAKNNTQAADIALAGVRENTKQAALALDDARLAGNNVESEAGDINRQIKDHLVSLDGLQLQATGEMQAAVMYTTQTLSDAKAVVEDGMRKDLIENEVRDDISREIAMKIVDTTSSAEEIKADLDALQQEATSDAQKGLPNRKYALNTLIGQEKAALDESAQSEIRKQTAYNLDQQTESYITDIISRAQKAALLYEQAQQNSAK